MKFEVENYRWEPPDKASTRRLKGTGWDRRGIPSIYVVCTGKGSEHKESVVAKAVTLPFDATQGEASDWVWDESPSVGGEPLHPVTRMRERTNARKLTEEEMDSIEGERPSFTPETATEPQVPGAMGLGTQDPEVQKLLCRRCGLAHDIRQDDLRRVLDAVLNTPAMERKINLYGLIRSRT